MSSWKWKIKQFVIWCRAVLIFEAVTFCDLLYQRKYLLLEDLNATKIVLKIKKKLGKINVEN